MIRSMDTLKRSFNVIQVKQENMSANAANVTTPGYKFQQVIQSTLESSDMVNYMNGSKLDQRQELGSLELGNQVEGMYRHFENGGLHQTSQPTDIAIQGNGFFTIQTPEGLAYTRNGQFTTNDAGTLVTQEGYAVLGRNAAGVTGLIQVGNSMTVGQNGMVSDSGMQLLITDIPNLGNLESRGDTLFVGAAGIAIDNPQVMQGYIETSNVETADLMIEMMQISREFEANQKVLQASDDTLRRAVNDLGKI